MAKKVHTVNLKGTLHLDFASGEGTVTEQTKDAENTYNLFSILEDFNGKMVKISLTEEDELPTVDIEE